MDNNKINWENRSKEMICKTCMYFVLKAPTDNFGRCRRHAPTMSGYPAVFDTDWCGDHKIDENKLSPKKSSCGWVEMPNDLRAMSSDDPRDWTDQVKCK